ncbi:MAG TPA: Rieske 2Fe-2S domain-containing protein [Candidatus Polarisedimenticolaceae bacterium]|nr:Rieske 2Fe-2S domain-containing protein [Candidatus Polarisedimenticolaceae bacterium]
MGRWVPVAEAAQLPQGAGRTVLAGERRVALFREGAELFALDDTCPHQGASLGTGTYHAGHVICPLHQWVFDVRTGHCPRETHEPVGTYRTRCVGGVVQVELPEGG